MRDLLKPYQPILAQCFISHRNQSFDLQRKSNEWFLYEIQHWVDMGWLELKQNIFHE